VPGSAISLQPSILTFYSLHPPWPPVNSEDFTTDYPGRQSCDRQQIAAKERKDRRGDNFSLRSLLSLAAKFFAVQVDEK
jgi:hypothetical protein